MGEYADSSLDYAFGALSDPTRRAILDHLSRKDTRVTDMARYFTISLNSVSKHVNVLERAGLVRRTIHGRDHVLSLNAAPMAEAAAWMETYRAFWDERLAALERFALSAEEHSEAMLHEVTSSAPRESGS
jgi:DNA-binding transcriptional ArsR family regulator